MTPRRAHVAILLACALCAGGCARLFDHYDVGPNGLARADQRLRRLIATDADSAALAAALGNPDALPSDPLLAHLYGGVLAYHAAAYGRSAALLDSATLIIDERATLSASRAALSLISTDRVMPYQAGTTERLLLHYYAALAWLRLGSVEDAAVEARRLSLLLEREPPADLAQQQLHAALRHVAAVLFALAGETADANVAWRNALVLVGDSSAGVHMPRPVHDSIDAYVVIERGFVGHRAEQAITLWLPGDEVGRLRGDDASRFDMATLIAARIAAAAHHDRDGYATLNVPPPPRSQAAADAGRAFGHTDCATSAPAQAGDDSAAVRAARTRTGFAVGCTTDSAARSADADGNHDDNGGHDDSDDAPYLMRIAWPVFRDFSPPLGPATVRVDNARYAPLVRASVSSAVARDLREDRALLVARTVARAAAKLALTRGIEDELREKDKAAADLFALLGNITAVVTEQADTRSWTLLPGMIEIARVRVPASAQTLQVEANGHVMTVPLAAHGGPIRLLHVSL